jgi:hypothetical protein
MDRDCVVCAERVEPTQPSEADRSGGYFELEFDDQVQHLWIHHHCLAHPDDDGEGA